MLKAMFNGEEEGKARMEEGGHDKDVASSKFNTNIQKSIPYLWPKWRQNGQNRYPIYVQTGWKTLPFGAAHTYIAHIRGYPPGQLSWRINEPNSWDSPIIKWDKKEISGQFSFIRDWQILLQFWYSYRSCWFWYFYRCFIKKGIQLE